MGFLKNLFGLSKTRTPNVSVKDASAATDKSDKRLEVSNQGKLIMDFNKKYNNLYPAANLDLANALISFWNDEAKILFKSENAADDPVCDACNASLQPNDSYYFFSWMRCRSCMVDVLKRWVEHDGVDEDARKEIGAVIEYHKDKLDGRAD